MSELRLEDLWAIVQGLGLVVLALFSIMALIALWPKIATALCLLFRVGAWRMAPSLSTLADDLRERTLRRRRVKAFRAATLIGRARGALEQDRRSTPHYVQSSRDTDGIEMVPAVPDTATNIDHGSTTENFTEDQWFRSLALARLPNGQWRFSGKKLFPLFGGNHNDFVAKLRRVREGDGDLANTVARTPIADRTTSAKFMSGLQK